MRRIRDCWAKEKEEEDEGLNRGAWTAGEDKVLTDYINAHGEGKWRSLPNRAGLKRCGKSCRLRWLNYLRPDIKRGNISQDEQDLILRLHKLLGNRWSLIAGRLPGRTDNEIKNYWNTIMSKKLHLNPPPAPRLRHNTQKPSSPPPPPSAAIQLPPPPYAIKTKPTRLISSNSNHFPFMITSTTTTTAATTTSSTLLPIFDDQTSNKQPCSLTIMPSSSPNSSSDNNNHIHKFLEFGFPSTTTTGDFHQKIITTTTTNNDYWGLLFPENFNWMGAGSGGGINIFDGGNVCYEDDVDAVFSQFPDQTGVVMKDWLLD